MSLNQVTNKTFQELLSLGLFGSQSSGIQIDLNIAWKKGLFQEVHLCDHNCTLQSKTNPNGGGYACPAAFSLPKNHGSDPKSLVSLEDVLTGIHTATVGLQSLQQEFLTDLQALGYTKEIIEGIAEGFTVPEINLFGGNPEMHPKIHDIIAVLKGEGYSITLTTTGKRFLMSPEFVRKILVSPPSKIALSADDLPVDVGEIRRLAGLSQLELRVEYKKIPPTAGQKQKALEAIHVLGLANRDASFPPLMLNYVLHPGNVEKALEVMLLLGELYPKVQINPYPAQSAFSGDSAIFSLENLTVLEQIIDCVIKRHFTQLEGDVDFRVVPRLHYYLLLKAVFLAYPDNLERVSEILSGYGLWCCYENPLLTGRYLQIGAGNSPLIRVETGKRPSPGGHPGCFWNSTTVTNPGITVWNSTSQQVRKHIAVEMKQLSGQSQKPCQGCGFPRLVFDEPSLMAGIPTTVVLDSYLLLRKEYVRF